MVATLSEDLRLRTFASQNPELRVWTEPRSIVAKTGKEFNLKMYAESGHSDDFIPQVKVTLFVPEGLTVGEEELTYNKPFNGKVLVGNIKVTVNKEGIYTLGIPDGGVYTQLSNAMIVTQGTQISSHY